MWTQNQALHTRNPFLQSLQQKIEPHLLDSNLNVKKLLRLVAMSRTDLHRKLEKAAGLSATEYIRHLRLSNASRLLLERPNWSIYQVALEVGFSSHSYFTRRWRELYGCSPMEWRERKLDLEHL